MCFYFHLPLGKRTVLFYFFILLILIFFFGKYFIKIGIVCCFIKRTKIWTDGTLISLLGDQSMNKKFQYLGCVWIANFFTNLFYYLACFSYYSWTLLHFLVLFISLTILFQLTFIFIYNTFNKKFSVSKK